LRYQGDYNGGFRKLIKKYIVCNYFKEFKKAMKDRAFLVAKQDVPEARFNERIARLNK